MKKTIFCTGLFLMISYGFSQSNTMLTGKVINRTTGKCIEGVSVVVLRHEKGTATDADGRYELLLPAGTYTLSFSAMGFTTTTKKITLKKKEETLNIGLNASELALSEVVIASNQQKETGVHHVSKLALKMRPVNSAQDLLRTVPGVFIAQHAGGGKAEQIFLRGFDNDHGTDFGVFVDHIPVNLGSHAHGQGYADLHFLIPETVDDASYYKGPHETSLGNFVVSGAAAYRTKNRLERNQITLEYGQYDFLRALGMVTLLDRAKPATSYDQNAFIAVEGTYNNSFFERPQQLRRLNTLTKHILAFHDKNTLTTSLSTFHSDWNASGQIPLRAIESGIIGRFGAIDDTEGGDTRRIQLYTRLQTEFNEVLKLDNQLYYFSNTYNLYSNFSFFLNDMANGDMIHQYENRDVFGYNGTLNIRTDVGTISGNAQLGLGIQYTDNTIVLNTATQRIWMDTVSTFDLAEGNYSLYAKEYLEITPKLAIQTGIRGDYFTFNVHEVIPNFSKKLRTAFRFSPKFSVFYNVTKNFQLYGKASRGYHSNYAQSAVDDPSVDPLPKATGYDLGSEFKIGSDFIAHIAGWYIKSDAEYVYLADGFEFENKGQSERIGADVSIRYQPLPYLWFDADLNYSYGTLLNEPEMANKIPAAPRLTSVGGVLLKLTNGIKSTLRYRYMAQRPLVEDASVEAESYFLLDAVMSYRKPDYEIRISVENLWNQQWMEAVFYDASQLREEPEPVEDFHFTPGTPFMAKLGVTYFF